MCVGIWKQAVMAYFKIKGKSKGKGKGKVVPVLK
jgi:hypothetical protein